MIVLSITIISKSPDLTLRVEPQDNKLKGIIQLKEVKARIIFKITFKMSFYFHMLPPIRVQFSVQFSSLHAGTCNGTGTCNRNSHVFRRWLQHFCTEFTENSFP